MHSSDLDEMQQQKGRFITHSAYFDQVGNSDLLIVVISSFAMQVSCGIVYLTRYKPQREWRLPLQSACNAHTMWGEKRKVRLGQATGEFSDVSRTMETLNNIERWRGGKLLINNETARRRHSPDTATNNIMEAKAAPHRCQMSSALANPGQKKQPFYQFDSIGMHAVCFGE